MIVQKDKAKEYEGFKQTNQDPYGACIVNYAERWADLMEEKINDGVPIQDIAKTTSNIADIEGITGFMYGMAVNILSNFWEHGEALRTWHNKSYNHNGDGVVNPAILTIMENE